MKFYHPERRQGELLYLCRGTECTCAEGKQHDDVVMWDYTNTKGRFWGASQRQATTSNKEIQGEGNYNHDSRGIRASIQQILQYFCDMLLIKRQQESIFYYINS